MTSHRYHVSESLFTSNIRKDFRRQSVALSASGNACRRRRKRSQTSVCSTFTTATTTADDDNDILSLLCHTALTNPNRPAIASGIHSKGPLDAVTYAKLFNFSHTLARSKVLRDVEIGERVGIYCAPNAEFVASVYAIWMRGAVAVPVSAFGDEADRAHVARDSGMKTCLVPPRRNDGSE